MGNYLRTAGVVDRLEETSASLLRLRRVAAAFGSIDFILEWYKIPRFSRQPSRLLVEPLCSPVHFT